MCEIIGVEQVRKWSVEYSEELKEWWSLVVIDISSSSIEISRIFPI